MIREDVYLTLGNSTELELSRLAKGAKKAPFEIGTRIKQASRKLQSPLLALEQAQSIHLRQQ